MAGGYGLLFLSTIYTSSIHSSTPSCTLTSYRCPFFRRVRDQSPQALAHSLLLSFPLAPGWTRLNSETLSWPTTTERIPVIGRSRHVTSPILHSRFFPSTLLLPMCRLRTTSSELAVGLYTPPRRIRPDIPSINDKRQYSLFQPYLYVNLLLVGTYADQKPMDSG